MAEFNLRRELDDTDRRLGLPAGFSRAQIQVESDFNPQAVSPKGARGLAQVMPKTQASLEQRFGRRLDPFNPVDAVAMHRELMRENLAQFGTPDRAAMAYNGGWSPEKWSNPETQAYAPKIRAAMGAGGSKVLDKIFSAVSGTAQAQGTSMERIDPTKVKWDGQAVGQSIDPGRVQWDEAPPEGRSMGAEALRQIGLTGRAAASGVGSLVSMVGDPLNATINAVTGGRANLQPVSQTVQGILDKIFPQPEGATERVVQDVAGSMAGGAGMVGAANKVAATASSPLVQTVARLLGQGAGNQIVSSGTAGAGAGMAREGGLGPAGQVIGALAGGVAPAAGAAAARGVARVARPITAAVSNRAAETAAAERLATTATQAADGSAMTPQEVLALRVDQALPDAEIVPGSRPTTAQATGDSRMLMAERARRSNQPEFGAQFADRLAEQQAAQAAQLDQVSPVTKGINEAGQDAGGVIRKAYDNEVDVARKMVNDAFAPLEASTEPTMTLPQEKVREVVDKFLGEGSKGPKGDLARIVRDIENLPNASVPKDEIRAILSRYVATDDAPQIVGANGAPMRAPASDDIVKLMADIRKLPEKADPEQVQRLKDQLGTMIQQATSDNDAGKTELLQQVLGAVGNQNQPVPFKTLQNLKSSAGEYATEAAKNMQMTAAKAAGDVRTLLDDVPISSSTFTEDQAAQYRLANDIRTWMAERLETGPALDMMRQGGDSAAKLQGGEIPRAFFNNRATSLQDIRQFKRAVGKNPEAVAALRNYAVTGLNDFATNQATGQFTPSKFGKWMDSHAPALGELFPAEHLSKLRAIAQDLERASASNTVGRAPGSDTAMNLAEAGIADKVISRIPGGRLIIGLVNKVSDEQIGKIVNRAMLDPEFASVLLARVGPSNRGILSRKFAQGLAAAGIGRANSDQNAEQPADSQDQ